MNLRRILSFTALLFLTASPVLTAQNLASERAATLEHGINLSGWFASSRDLSPQHIATFTTATDLEAIHTMGFDFVRLGIDPSLVERHGEVAPANPETLTELDHAVQEALANDLEVMLCVFPNDDYKHNLDTERGVDDFVQLWRILATHFVAEDHARIFYELMNEPEVSDPYRWMGIQSRVDEAIRRIDPYHTIIATAANYSNPTDLLRLEPLADPNVIYNFHFYEPHQFTHQGASWGADNWIFYKNIPYPVTAAQLTEQLKNVPDDLDRYELYEYGMDNWNAQGIAGRIAFLADWARERHVPLICNEFGVYRETAPPASRERWIHDVRTALEANHIGWAMWDYRGNFGIVTRTATQIIPDDATLKALGLNANAQPEFLSGQ
ncbi:MAG TPA: cellulase family glycosylhydrolase [Acidobacteriaceae bacterium]|nr:cellulase family glycosylhydrolase [Acidobacteriaceae bacterium]